MIIRPYGQKGLHKMDIRQTGIGTTGNQTNRSNV